MWSGKRLLKNSETKNLGCFWMENCGFAGIVFDRPYRTAAPLFSGFVAIRLGSELHSLITPRQPTK